eukprot:NODE_822_length_1166_cov_236.429722_g545_i1.p1 GENE.NODE_822_length_1166_cov_236.429722_g545_i1~~NODE_822_length_1166_cov_236.429722_g545_i1.p1  ORF type:complete len:298 (-),score=154.84 NODE_822_length_1166_cov_236.429722_g545_i1:244-1137(-)
MGREHLLLAHQVGIPNLIVFINKVDDQPDPDMLELVEMEVRELLDKHQFDSSKVTFIYGSAMLALAGDAAHEAKIVELTKALDALPLPARPVDLPFLMAVEHVYNIAGRGTVATGRIEQGKIRPGDSITVNGYKPSATTTCTAVETFKKTLDEGQAGDSVGLLLRNLKKDQVQRGMVIAAPGSVISTRKFLCQIYVLKKEEGGRQRGFFDGYRPQFFLRTADISGKLSFPELPEEGAEKEMVLPGDTRIMMVDLEFPACVHKGMNFAVREGGLTIGAGVVTEVIEEEAKGKKDAKKK